MFNAIVILLGGAFAGWLVMLGVLVIVGRHAEFLRGTRRIFRREYLGRLASIAIAILILLMIFSQRA